MESLCRTYWYPLYAYVRQRGYGVQDAEDLIQEFFARFLAKSYLAHVQPARGRFRNYLLGALNHFLSDAEDWRTRKKRGGGVLPLRLDCDSGEDLLRIEPVDHASPDWLYERRWAVALLNRVLLQLGDEYRREGKGRLFRVLRSFLVEGSNRLAYVAARRQLDMTDGALRVAVHRLRRRYGELFRSEVGLTVSDAGEIDEEIRHLLEVLSR